MSFKKNKYQVITWCYIKRVSRLLLIDILQVSAEADNWMINNYVTHAGNPLVGNFHDPQVPRIHMQNTQIDLWKHY